VERRKRGLRGRGANGNPSKAGIEKDRGGDCFFGAVHCERKKPDASVLIKSPKKREKVKGKKKEGKKLPRRGDKPRGEQHARE